MGAHNQYGDLRYGWILDTGASGHLVGHDDFFVPVTYRAINGSRRLALEVRL